MDIERIQKINNLALDLIKQGLAETREDAIAQAEKIFSSNNDNNLSNVSMEKNSLQVSQENPINFENEGNISDVQDNSVDTSAHLDEFKEIIEKNTKFMVSKIKEFQEKVSSLENQLSTLKDQIRNNSANLSRKVPEEKKTEENSLNVGGDNNLKKSDSTDNDDKVHPRSGNFNETDVSIEKFFYAGNK